MTTLPTGRVTLAAAAALLAAACEPVQNDDGASQISDEITISSSAMYTIVGVQSNKCVEVQGGSTAAGARLQIATCNGTTRQQFKAEVVGSGTYRLRNVNSSLCVDVTGASTTDGAAVIQWTCGTAMNQQWSFTDVYVGIERLTAAHSGKVLDVTANSTVDGALLEQWTWNGGTNQQFKLQVVGGGSGRLIGGTCWPVCSGAGADPDGDGWGWENNASCVASGSSAYNQGAACGAGTGSGGATGTGGATGSGGGTTACSAVPVTPNATQQTRNALCYLYQIYGKQLLSGQEENNDDNGMNYIYSTTGRYPAIRAFDVNNSSAAAQCAAHVKNKGLCMIGYHMGIINGDGYASAQTRTDINQVLAEGSSYNVTFKARLDKVAAVVKAAQDANGVAIMRLFHEAGGAWFWWSMETGAQYVRLYKYAFNYLTATKGLRNMLWMLPYNGSPNSSFYPGKAYVDLGGADTYAGDGNYDPQNALYRSCVAIFGTTMPIALHECGPIPDPGLLQSTGTKWVLFNVWTSPYYQAPSNSVSHLQSVYGSSYVITRDELPGF